MISTETLDKIINDLANQILDKESRIKREKISWLRTIKIMIDDGNGYEFFFKQYERVKKLYKHYTAFRPKEKILRTEFDKEVDYKKVQRDLKNLIFILEIE